MVLNGEYVFQTLYSNRLHETYYYRYMNMTWSGIDINFCLTLDNYLIFLLCNIGTLQLKRVVFTWVTSVDVIKVSEVNTQYPRMANTWVGDLMTTRER